MATLETTFAGLKLKNPIIISSSGLTDSAAKNQSFTKPEQEPLYSSLFLRNKS